MYSSKSKRISHPMTLLFLLFLFIMTAFSEKTNGSFISGQLPAELLNFNTIFLSIIIEAVPFILLGSIISVLIQSYIRDDFIPSLLPSRPILAILPASFIGAFFPVCECAIIPIIRGLIKKGLPQHLGIVMIISIPILNPIVFLSTYYAFQSNPKILYGRMGLTVIAAFIIGCAVYYLFRHQTLLRKSSAGSSIGSSHQHHHDHSSTKPHFNDLILHMSSEFFDTAKYFFIGALLAGLFQTFFNQHMLAAVGSNEIKGPAVMMGLAYLLSVCSTSDAFLASSFSNLFTPGSLVAFLIFGAMLDIKNTLMMLSCFKFRFVLTFCLMTSAVVYTLARFFDFFF